MARIGEQRDRIDPQADDRLDRDERDVEPDADREGAVEGRRGMAMAVPAMAVAMALRMLVMMSAQGLRSTDPAAA